MDKAILLALLASHGVTLANDATDEQIKKALEDKLGAVKVSEEQKVILANDKTKAEGELATAKGVISEKETALANETAKVTDLNGKLAAATAAQQKAEGELATTKEKLTVAETTLANATAERGKTAHEAATLATQLTEAKTTITLRDAALSNEKTEHSKVKAVAAAAKKAIVDLAVAFGKITPARRDELTEALANEISFGKVCDDLKAAKPFFKMAPLINVGKDTGSVLEPEKQFRVLVNEALGRKNIDPAKATPAQRDAAWAEVKSSEQGKAVLGMMKQPESGIPVVQG